MLIYFLFEPLELIEPLLSPIITIKHYISYYNIKTVYYPLILLQITQNYSINRTIKRQNSSIMFIFLKRSFK